jgi:FMN reductase (NADPH)
MLHNPVIDTLVQRKSIRKYTTEDPSDEVVQTIVRAGQQAPFAFQMGSVLLSRKREQNPFHAPLLFTLCVDSHRHELVMAQRGWKMATNDLSLLFFGIQDATLLAANMVSAAESLGLGSCFIGNAPYRATQIADEYRLPQRVFPLVQLTMGYPASKPKPRPRYPLDFCLFEDTYPELDEENVTQAMQVMDEGYLAQDYYRKANYIIPLEEGREEKFTYENYGWTEHISRKTGQWLRSIEEITSQLEYCGFYVGAEKPEPHPEGQPG